MATGNSYLPSLRLKEQRKDDGIIKTEIHFLGIPDTQSPEERSPTSVCRDSELRGGPVRLELHSRS